MIGAPESRLQKSFPNSAPVNAIQELDAEALTHDVFYREFIDKRRPCVVRRAVLDWPAFKLWRSSEYLCEKIGNPDVVVQVGPLVEYPNAARRNPELLSRMENSRTTLSFKEFMSQLASGQRGHCVLHASPVRPGSVLEPLIHDFGGFSFLTNPRPARDQGDARVFMYRDAYTDWHFHSTDESLMCQVKGRKKVMLLPPDSKIFQTLNAIAGNVGYIYDLDADRFPTIREFRPLVVTVEAGDALYIPTFWWHAAESLDAEWGVTLARCWASPLHLFDVRLAGVRYIIRRVLFTKLGLLAITAAMYSFLYNIIGFRPFPRRPPS
jgi:hypothetical protein